MIVSTKGRYALRVMVDLAENEKDGRIPLKEIAVRQDISQKYIEAHLLLPLHQPRLRSQQPASAPEDGCGFLGMVSFTIHFTVVVGELRCLRGEQGLPV